MDADSLAKILWNYQVMKQKLEKADAIIALGSHDIRVGEYAARLLLDGWAPLLVVSGGIGRLTEKWPKAEAELFAEAAIKKGVPKEKILVENKSTNSQENILFTKALLDEKGISIKRVILVQKPYMERRAYATFKKQWPGVEVVVTSPQISYEQYDLSDRPPEEKIHILVGDTQRIKLYGEKGFMIPQEIPTEVWSAYEQLVTMGYDAHVLKE
jgi:uncharacterized SAM-binding protein YcdF (DUF218 family)